MESATHPHHKSWNSTRLRDRLPERLRAMPLPRPELAVLLGLAALLYLWGLSKNGWANDYYSAAVRSMAGSWHDFLYGSFDAKGLMTVDKPPLALWVEALSAKVFGFNSLVILVPQALMGVASVGLLYDLTRRRWGRVAGTVAGLPTARRPNRKVRPRNRRARRGRHALQMRHFLSGARWRETVAWRRFLSTPPRPG